MRRNLKGCMAGLVGLILSSVPGWAWADPGSAIDYPTVLADGKAVGLDLVHNKLYFVAESSSNSDVAIYDVDANGIYANPTCTNLGINTAKSLALDVVKQRLYIANYDGTNNLTICRLDGTGQIFSWVCRSDFSAAGGYALALDSRRRKLYTAVGSPTHGLAVYTLDANGDYASHTPYQTEPSSGGEGYSLCLDPVRSKLYLGMNGKIQVWELDEAGNPSSIQGTTTANGGGLQETMDLDSARKHLFSGSPTNTLLQVLTLDDTGLVFSSATIANPVGIRALLFDATRSMMYATNSNLYYYTLLPSGALSGSILNTAAVSSTRSIALDAKRGYLYTAADSFSGSKYFQLSDPSMPPLLVNHGALSTTTSAVDLHWCVPNARWVMVDPSSHLDHFYFPVSSPANTDFGQWISADGGRWSNDGGVSRAVTLTVRAQLSGAPGLAKMVKVWFWEGSGASNSAAVVRAETVYIDYVASGTPTDTPTQTLTPTRSPTFTATHSPTVTLSQTPTSTLTHTASPTPTATWSPSLTRTPTPTATHTPSPTASATPSITPTMTCTPSPTLTATLSPSATFTATPSPSGTRTPSPSPTLSATLSPTRTWTPSVTPTAVLSATPSVSPSPTLSSTPSPTLTAVLSPTWSATSSPSGTRTPSFTPTPSLSPTLTRTASCTHTPVLSPTPSATRTATSTITLTLTITLTPQPTDTPAPADVLFLSANAFRPDRERLSIRVGSLEGGHCTLKIFGMSGKNVCIIPMEIPAGYTRAEWDGRNSQGEPLASGLYYVVLEGGQRREVKKVILIR